MNVEKLIEVFEEIDKEIKTIAGAILEQQENKQISPETKAELSMIKHGKKRTKDNII